MPSVLKAYSWYLRSPKDMDTGDDVDISYFPKGSYDPVSLRIRGRTAPTGRDFIVDVKAAGVSLLDPRVQGRLPNGLTDHSSTDVASVKGNPGDPLTLSLVQIGSGEPGRGVTVEMTVDEEIIDMDNYETEATEL